MWRNFFYASLIVCAVIKASQGLSAADCPNGIVENCVMSPCQTATCPGRPSATCRRHDCQCMPTWWEGTTDVTSRCQDTTDLAEKNAPSKFGSAGVASRKPCPLGTPRVSCQMAPCATSTCSRHPNAECRNNYCGGCNAEYWIGLREVTSECTLSHQPRAQASRGLSAADCSNGVVENCVMSPCQTATCPGRPSATCRRHDCQCMPTWWEGTTDVTSRCQDNIDLAKQNPPFKFGSAGVASRKRCAFGTPRVSCQMAPCATSTCDRHPNAQCRNNYCGGCNTEYWVGLREVTSECSSSDLSLSQGNRNVNDVARGARPVNSCPNTCLFSPCLIKYCAAFPNAQCKYDTCKGCEAEFWLDGSEVTSRCNQRMPSFGRWGGFFNRYRQQQQPRRRNVFSPLFAFWDSFF